MSIWWAIGLGIGAAAVCALLAFVLRKTLG